MKQPFVVLAGPTAVGKSELSIELAKRIHGSVISADSMQVYKYMDIGSAKITKEEMKGIPHYLVDCFEPEEEFHVVRFQEEAKKAMKEIYEQGRIPILVGGTGFYIQAVLNDIDFTQENADTAYREELEHLAEEKGREYLHDMLKKVDEASAKEIHFNNVKRVIRALEFYKKTGMPISEHNEAERQKTSPYNAAYFVLNDDRDKLYEKINLRVDKMIEMGLVEEVRGLLERGCHKEMVSMQGLGYKEIIAYLEGECTLEEAIYLIKRDTRHFAKRQLTWFRREKEVLWINKEAFGYENEKIVAEMLTKLKEKGIVEHV